MIDKAARQKRLEAANQFLAYFATVGYHYFYRQEWPYQSHIELRTLPDGYRQSCFFVDGGTGEEVKIVWVVDRLESIVGVKAARILYDLKEFIMDGKVWNGTPVWVKMPRGIHERAQELGIK